LRLTANLIRGNNKFSFFCFTEWMVELEEIRNARMFVCAWRVFAQMNGDGSLRKGLLWRVLIWLNIQLDHIFDWFSISSKPLNHLNFIGTLVSRCFSQRDYATSRFRSDAQSTNKNSKRFGLQHPWLTISFSSFVHPLYFIAPNNIQIDNILAYQ
jgi:hypothetical protein